MTVKLVYIYNLHNKLIAKYLLSRISEFTIYRVILSQNSFNPFLLGAKRFFLAR